ncbi:glucosamine-6-phosphate deaminase [Rhodococcus sp. 06-412-2C]|uniref:glucosamine-6-phosphate deaminase n=1 Tax=unclassified Rhodococcus (in: high G+C Gram-positive bacteria) TaxID=192944 RepID=UPI000B9A5AF9|nr:MULTISPECIES: glucosamine-6-phosphate deaminase [unclassified Rhodococcus (in: high G+C Gram-positive bacteria)]OZC93536.1 glucosamine-6-phosphate deaminase [Rhodococcus sp. 06-412-2C]OZD03711.1 glucosamine-6-phosphate deaminase [Rhodococcus sp. 06-412-2B]
MEIVILDGVDAVDRTAADIVERTVRTTHVSTPVLGLATGSTPVGTYRELARRHRDEGLSFSHCRAFLLDEYIGLARSAEQSYFSFIRENFVDHVDLDDAAVFSPDGEAHDIAAEAQRYDAAIAEAGGIDVQILGIGTDGHIGFNEPGSSLRSRTRVKTLTEQTRTDNARFFDSPDAVPHHVLTQGLGTIDEARHLVLIATGESKAEAVAAAVEGPLSAHCPASVIQWHPHVSVLLDEAAASALALAEYYRYAYANKPGWQHL